MSQHTDPGFEPRVADWLEDGPTQAPRDVMATVRAALPSVKQRRAGAPWRNPVMSQLTKVAAAAAIVVAVGAGAYLLGSNAPNASPGPAGADAMATYREARDAVCEAAAADVAPLADAFVALWEPSAPQSDVEAGAAAIRSYIAISEEAVRGLSAIRAPAELAEDHAAATTRLDDVLIMLRQVVAHLDAGEIDAALAIERTTDPVARRLQLFELEHDLAPCP